MNNMKKVISILILLGVTVCSPPAYTKNLTKVYGPNCTTETTSIVQNGIIVSEIQTTTCKEEVLNGKQKFDPDKNAGDALLYEATQLMMYSVFVKLITEMN
tara:strand:- start:729 stop:1031 length:303 start_codon:yes stop_codon:yes gene_type:complete